MKVLGIQNCETEGIGTYEDYLKEKNIEYDIFHAYKNHKFPEIENYDVIIVGGTPISVNKINEHEFLRNEFNYLKKSLEMNKPYFGICFGGQLLAKLLGAEVIKNKVMEIGGYKVKLTEDGKKDELFKGFPEKFPVSHWHGDTFDVPEQAKLLVEGIDCKNQAFRYKNAVALQFHPEVNSEKAAKWADKYSNELEKVNKTKEQVVEECRKNEEQMAKLSYLILDNFFKLVNQ